jgi:hypothetical protein
MLNNAMQFNPYCPGRLAQYLANLGGGQLTAEL